VANVPRRWEFYRAETGAVIDTVDDINMMQANAVRADIVRRYGHPDESVRMRSVPTAASAERVRARATLGEPRPAFGDVADVEPDVAQNFPAGPQQRNIGGSLAWEIYNRENGDVVRTFWNSDEAAAVRYAQDYMDDNPLPGSYSIRPQMTANESRDIRESAMMGKIESTGKIVRIIRKQHSVKFSDQKDWLLIDTDPGKGNQGAGLKWLPASTRFEWVRPYRETVDEVFDTKIARPKWSIPLDNDMISLQFTASNGVPYTLDFLAPHMGPDEMGPLDFFDDLSDEAYERARFVEFEQTAAKPYSTGKQGIEGTGSAAEVFGIVSNAMKQYVKKFQPSMLYFQAAEPSRQSLYARMLAKVAQGLGWGYKQDGGHFVIFDKKAQLTEAFDQPYALHWASPRDDTVLAMTKLNDGSPLVIRFDSEGDHWQVVFDRNSSFEVTGEGDAQRIFATVLSAIGQFVKEHEPQSLTFSASKDVDTGSANPESRAKLYNRLVQRYASSVGYKVHSREQGDEVVYLLQPNVAVAENFADGKGPGRPGDSVRHGIPKKATMAELEKASHAKGRKGQLARWQINMRRGKAKK